MASNNFKNQSKQNLVAEISRLKKELKKKKKYGLVWEDKPEEVVEQCMWFWIYLRKKQGTLVPSFSV